MPERFISFLAGSGITIFTIVFGTLGAALGIAYSPKMEPRQMWAALFSGLACASLIPQICAHYWPMPEVVKNGLAFFFGVVGLFIVPGFLVVGQRFKENPFWLIEWLLRLKNGEGPKP